MGIERYIGGSGRSRQKREEEKIQRGAREQYRFSFNPLKKNQDAINRGGIRKRISEQKRKEWKQTQNEVRKRYRRQSPAEDVEKRLAEKREQFRKGKGVDKYPEGSSLRARKEREVEDKMKYYRREQERSELRNRKSEIDKKYRHELKQEYKRLNDQYRRVRQRS